MDLLHSNLGYDRAAIMALAHLEYQAGFGRRKFGACLKAAWDQAKRQRAERASGVVDERLRAMRAHHVAAMRARVARASLDVRAH